MLNSTRLVTQHVCFSESCAFTDIPSETLNLRILDNTPKINDDTKFTFILSVWCYANIAEGGEGHAIGHTEILLTSLIILSIIILMMLLSSSSCIITIFFFVLLFRHLLLQYFYFTQFIKMAIVRVFHDLA